MDQNSITLSFLDMKVDLLANREDLLVARNFQIFPVTVVISDTSVTD